MSYFSNSQVPPYKVHVLYDLFVWIMLNSYSVDFCEGTFRAAIDLRNPDTTNVLS